VANDNQGRLTVWGRANSVNVQKVLWCLRELDLGFQRIDAGMAFGRNHDPDYLAMNPNARVPTLVDGDFVLWESNSIMRYLVLAYGKGSPVYPEAPKRRAGVDHYPAVEDVGRVERVTGKCGAGAEEGQLHQARRVLGFITPAGSNISWIRPR